MIIEGFKTTNLPF